MRLHMVNIHFDPYDRETWRTDLEELQEHILSGGHTDAFVVDGDFNTDPSRGTQRGEPANRSQAFFDVTRLQPPPTTPAWGRWG